ncbi:hypothetical protein NHX12_004456 [Muraenolepis orangiensis]|uniref:LRRCT domain-containing protein n=1 Tax=Muraenolepis orangiensis TaxID=630683 RepID=A0A9Q0IC80_9TELE|nr:hypothetical protein NHX12_004456 [Muraenolepis orangiensis]
MTSTISITLCLMLLSSRTQTSRAELPHLCPITCQCFSANKVLCTEQRMSSLPKNLSREVKEVIVMTTSLMYLLPNTFQGSPRLAKLVFLNNAIRDIHARAFENLTHLEELDLSGNPWLEHLVQGTFSQQGNLTKLQLNFNKLKTLLPDTFGSLRNLETLEMKGNLIAHLPVSLFRNLQHLQCLDLSGNWLEEVTREDLEALTELRTLKLNNNLLSRLSADTFHNVSHLRELHLEGNSLNNLPRDVFSVLTNLEVLNLRGNFLSNFSSEAFGHFPSSLKELTLQGNELVELSDSSFHGLTSLTSLVLSTNQLSQLPVDLFQNLTALENLDLSENHLTSLPEEIFNDLRSVKTLHLQKNNLTKMAAKLFEDQSLLRQLHLSDNLLQTIAPGLFASFNYKHVVRLHGNPWQCDCQVSYLHHWMLHNSVDMEEQDKVRCRGPKLLSGRTLASIDKDRLVCRLPEDSPPMADGANCTLRATNGIVIVKCRVDACSPLRVRVQFEAEDGTVYENVVQRQWPDNKQCNNNNNNNTIYNTPETP